MSNRVTMGINNTDTPSNPTFTTMGRMLHQRLAAPTWDTPIDPSKRQAAIGKKLTADLERLARQQTIENHLSAALHHVRHSDSTEGFSLACGRAIRAASLLKQACAGVPDDEPTDAEIQAEVDRAWSLGLRVYEVKRAHWTIGKKRIVHFDRNKRATTFEWENVKGLPKLKALNDAAQAAQIGGAA